MDKNTKKKIVESVPFWWHSIDLGDGIITPGQISMESQNLILSVIPEDLKGKTVLDVGGWDGFYSFECEKRGAKVTTIDNGQYVDFVRHKYGIKLVAGQGFRIAAQILKSHIRYEEVDIMDINDQFDIVLFHGVLYHQKHPLFCLEQLYRMTKEQAFVETHYIEGPKYPHMRFYPGDVLNQDPTNFWGPNIPCVEAMLMDVGFKSVSLEILWGDNDNRALFTAKK